jgi:anti-sigma factor RsiW
LTCEEARELVGPYLDDELSEESRRRLERHLLTCEVCGWEAASLRVTRDRLRSEADEVMASDAFRSRTLRLLRADNAHLAAESAEEPSGLQLPMPLF